MISHCWASFNFLSQNETYLFTTVHNCKVCSVLTVYSDVKTKLLQKTKDRLMQNWMLWSIQVDSSCDSTSYPVYPVKLLVWLTGPQMTINECHVPPATCQALWSWLLYMNMATSFLSTNLSSSYMQKSPKMRTKNVLLGENW